MEVDGDLVEFCCGVCVDAGGPGDEGGVARGGSAPEGLGDMCGEALGV